MFLDRAGIAAAAYKEIIWQFQQWQKEESSRQRKTDYIFILPKEYDEPMKNYHPTPKVQQPTAND